MRPTHKRLCKKPSIGRIAGGKPLRVWLFYWVPASAGTTNIEFLHSLISAGAELDLTRFSVLNRFADIGCYSTHFAIRNACGAAESDMLEHSYIGSCARNPARLRHWRKTLRVCVLYWVPACAGTTILGFLHSLLRRNDECWIFAQSHRTACGD